MTVRLLVSRQLSPNQAAMVLIAAGVPHAQVVAPGPEETRLDSEALWRRLRDKSWRDELARKTYVAVLELMGKPAPPNASVTRGLQHDVAPNAAPSSVIDDTVALRNPA